MWEKKTLKTTKKLAGPVGKDGVLGGVYRIIGCEMQEKPQKTNLSQNELIPSWITLPPNLLT